MLSDRGLEETALPETVQGIIAARLDAVSVEEKTAIQNAAVFGKVFWSGSLTALNGGDAQRLEGSLHALVRKEFIRRERRSSVGGQDEYAFRHVLVRDVAYGQIPRAHRAEKHLRAAEWIESLSERGEDLADLLAHHYVSALDYGAEGLGERRPVPCARPGDRSKGHLNSYLPAIRYYRAGLELLPDNRIEERGEILFELGHARFMAESEGAEQLEESVAILEERNPELAADALSTLAILSKQDQRRTFELLERALALVRDRPPTKQKATVLTTYGGQLVLAHEPARALELTREAVGIAEELGDVERQAEALLTLGNPPDMERALELAVASNHLGTAARCYGNLADACASHFADLERCFALQKEGRRLAERIGGGPLLQSVNRRALGGALSQGPVGRGDRGGRATGRGDGERHEPALHRAPTRSVLALIAVARDDVDAPSANRVSRWSEGGRSATCRFSTSRSRRALPCWPKPAEMPRPGRPSPSSSRNRKATSSGRAGSSRPGSNV